MIENILTLLTLLHLVVGKPLACLPSQPVEAVEGGSATLQSRLEPPIDLSSKIVEWNRGNSRVHVYRSRGDDPDSQMLQYRDRTTLNHGDLTRGVSTLTISNVSLSDNGSYEVYLPKLEVRCLTHLTVVKEEEQSKRNDSGTPAPPAEGDPAAEKRNHVWKAVLGVLGALLAAALIIVILVKLQGIRHTFSPRQHFFISVFLYGKKGGDPVVNGEELKELRTGATEGGEDQQKEGSEVKDHNNEPKEPSDKV